MCSYRLQWMLLGYCEFFVSQSMLAEGQGEQVAQMVANLSSSLEW